MDASASGVSTIYACWSHSDPEGNISRNCPCHRQADVVVAGTEGLTASRERRAE